MDLPGSASSDLNERKRKPDDAFEQRKYVRADTANAANGTSGLDGLLDLPDEMFGAILGLLVPYDQQNLRLVCHRLKILVDANVFCIRCRKQLSSPQFDSLTKRMPQLKQLWVEDACHITDRHLAAAAQLPSLVSFGIRNSDPVPTTFALSTWRLFVTSCRHLQHVSLPDMSFVTDDFVVALIDNCLELTLLNLSGCDMLTDAALDAMGKHCPRLCNLSVERCEITDRGVCSLTSSCLHLTALDISYCRDVTDSSLFCIGAYCRELETLRIAHCELVTDEGLVALSNGCPNLRSLKTRGCLLIRDEGLMAISRKCPLLRNLNTYGHLVTDQLLVQLSACPSVARLKVNPCDTMTDAGVAMLATNNLQSLCLVEYQPSSAITDVSMERLAHCCSSLTKLDVTAATMPSLNTLQQLVLNCASLRVLRLSEMTDEHIFIVASGLPKLRELRAARMALSDTALLCLAKHCPQLQNLTVRDECPVFTAGGIFEFSRACSALRTLDLPLHSQSACITDDAMIALAAHCRQLSVFKASCFKCTDVGVVALATSCPALRVLAVTGCTFTTVALQVIAGACTRVRVLDVSLSNIDTDGLRAIAEGFPRLSLLGRYMCRASKDVLPLLRPHVQQDCE
eukprot:TRINITY_DN3496_c0_g1_i1.p1 TRINITY_DN3496_c0_g1~~TRINITY_DN3496_c0_g1_i1.p1  ORF type:complete len:627 (+),score=97.22 TRINITY_DN3496_c0_g1_i1:1339-3219(+)